MLCDSHSKAFSKVVSLYDKEMKKTAFSVALLREIFRIVAKSMRESTM